ncbi:hypothetical protein IO355_001543 [Campylobacter upsaliensis]|nr:hypothetical protein [Campylobacter upsaliensis]EIR8269884.1 hypothetical protein [Campylobacter upsaliensis]EKB9601480.1 hypothetical protein [Campylobacter upsaliensis]
MLKRVLGKANSKQNRAFCKAAALAFRVARLKGKIWQSRKTLGRLGL